MLIPVKNSDYSNNSLVTFLRPEVDAHRCWLLKLLFTSAFQDWKVATPDLEYSKITTTQRESYYVTIIELSMQHIIRRKVLNF